jgi:hypothetical protein
MSVIESKIIDEAGKAVTKSQQKEDAHHKESLSNIELWERIKNTYYKQLEAANKTGVELWVNHEAATLEYLRSAAVASDADAIKNAMNKYEELITKARDEAIANLEKSYKEYLDSFHDLLPNTLGNPSLLYEIGGSLQQIAIIYHNLGLTWRRAA